MTYEATKLIAIEKTTVENGIYDDKETLCAHEMWSTLYDLEMKVGAIEYEYKDIIHCLLSIIKSGYDENNFYEQDIINKAKKLAEE